MTRAVETFHRLHALLAMSAEYLELKCSTTPAEVAKHKNLSQYHENRAIELLSTDLAAGSADRNTTPWALGSQTHRVRDVHSLELAIITYFWR